MTDTDGLTVGDVAARLGVTVRALHHWDDTGLVRPSLRTAAGYRLYTGADLERLQRVVAYREVGLRLDRIADVLDDTAVDPLQALQTQRAQVAERVDRLQQLGIGLDRMIEAHRSGLLLTVEQQAEIFGPHWDPDNATRARERYGDTEQWRQFAEGSASRTPEQWQQIADRVADLERAFGDAIDDAVPPGSPAADELVDRHRAVFASYFPLTRQMQVCLGRRFESEPGFAAHYNGIRPGLAGWLRQSIDARARADGVDPDTATWE